MSGLVIGIIGFVALLVLLALRIPIAVSMLSVGMVGYVSIAGPTALFSYLKTEMYWKFTSFDLSVAPLFIMMGLFAAKAGISQALFRAANVWLGHHRGGVAMA
ncbi:MAG: TRAP transporter large permease subunit, partial [Rhodospirillales bacterium]|nr:TRAP transporter large permease subunit [Rhodospirillales bacterium]